MKYQIRTICHSDTITLDHRINEFLSSMPDYDLADIKFRTEQKQYVSNHIAVIVYREKKRPSFEVLAEALKRLSVMLDGVDTLSYYGRVDHSPDFRFLHKLVAEISDAKNQS